MQALKEILKKDEGQVTLAKKNKGLIGFVVVDYRFVIADEGFVKIDWICYNKLRICYN